MMEPNNVVFTIVVGKAVYTHVPSNMGLDQRPDHLKGHKDVSDPQVSIGTTHPSLKVAFLSAPLVRFV